MLGTGPADCRSSVDVASFLQDIIERPYWSTHPAKNVVRGSCGKFCFEIRKMLFCKRRFREEGGGWIAPLELPTERREDPPLMLLNPGEVTARAPGGDLRDCRQSLQNRAAAGHDRSAAPPAPGPLPMYTNLQHLRPGVSNFTYVLMRAAISSGTVNADGSML